MSATIIRGNALDLPLADASVDLVVTSPPYFGLRSYQDGGEHYSGQIGAEPTPAEFVDALVAATREMVRVLKPSGSIWVNLGDKYCADNRGSGADHKRGAAKWAPAGKAGYPDEGIIKQKSLIGIPWRYALRCIDDLGLILRAEVIWAKPNGLPESVTDRVRRSHEVWFHFTKEPRYYSAVDEIREEYSERVQDRQKYAGRDIPRGKWSVESGRKDTNGERGILGFGHQGANPLGKLPGSVWTIPTQPLKVPPELGIDHFACVDTETEILTRRGWLRHDELHQGDECAGYDLDLGAARWTTVHAVNRYPFDGELVSVEKRDLSMRLTGNHRVLAQKRHGASGHRGQMQVVRADELTPAHFIPRSADWQDETATKSIGVDLAALLGWVASEGWINARRVMLSQSLTVNAAKVAEIDALIGRLGGTTYKTRQRVWRGREWTDCSWSLPRDLSADVMRLLPDKRLSWDLLQLPEDERRALLDAFVSGDGHRRADGRWSIFQHIDNAITVDVLQAIAVTLGYKTTRTADGDRWVLYLTTGGRSVTLRGTNGSNPPVGREHYTGTVWCPTTGTGTFVARRNGRVFITGNSFPMEWPRRIIAGWSPAGGTILDPFGGTGTTALVADVMGRRGISVDMSADYCRLAAWRTNDPKQRERAARGPKPAAKPKPPEKLAEVEFIHPDQLDLFEDGAA